MTMVQTPESNLQGKTSEPGTVSAPGSALSMLFDQQRDAVEAARRKGVQEVEVPFRIPAAEFVATTTLDDLEQLFRQRERLQEAPYSCYREVAVPNP